MKNALFLAAFLIITAGSYAQSRDRYNITKISLGPALGFATSNPLSNIPGNKGWGIGAGGILQVEHFFKENFSGVAQAGIISFAGRSTSSSTKNKAYTTIPLRVGANGFIGNFHIGAQVGVGINSRNSESVTAFAYSPQIGYNFSRNNVPLDFSVSYDGYAGNGGFSDFLMRLSLIF